MKSLSGLRRYLGTRAAIQYLHDYHQQRINPEGSWADALHCLWSYGGDEAEVIAHARFMDECGSDLINYRYREERRQFKLCR